MKTYKKTYQFADFLFTQIYSGSVPPVLYISLIGMVGITYMNLRSSAIDYGFGPLNVPIFMAGILGILVSANIVLSFIFILLRLLLGQLKVLQEEEFIL